MTETTDKKPQAEGQETAIDLLPEPDVQIQQEISRFTRKKPKKKWIILAVILVVVGGFGAFQVFGPKDTALPISTTTLEKTDLVNQISLSGTIESADSAKVYSKVSGGGLIQTVNVKVGDWVEAGDVLAQFDTEDLELSIAKQQASIAQAAKLNEHNIEVNRKKLENAQNNIDTGLDAELLAAENALRNAQQELNDARSEYNDAEDLHTSADDDLTKAEKAFYKAERERDDAEKAYNNALKDPDATDEEKKDLNDALKAKEDAYDEARRVLLNAEGAVDELSAERQSYRRARIAYENALASKNSIENSVNQSLDSYEDSIKGSELEADQTVSQLELKQLQKDLAESTVVAPISGTVTAVYAKEGAPASGSLLFVIENTDSLVVKTFVKEYDVATVKEGMKTEIKADATGEQVFDGEVQKIYPAAVKAEDGSTKSDSSSVEFETDVSLLSQDSGLRVGMNVRLNVIAAEKAGVYAVPFEAVATNQEGQEVVYTTTTDGEGRTIAKSIPVQAGMETDFYLEISAPELTDGMPIISSPAGITDGTEVRPLPAGMAAMNGVAVAG